MNTDQQARLEIMRALEKDFPDRLLEDLIDVARYVEGDGAPVSTVAREFRKAGVSGPRKWTNLDATPRTWTNLEAIPSTVKAITDRDGDRAEPQTIKGKRKWVFTDEPLDGVEVSPDDGPFIEVLDHE